VLASHWLGMTALPPLSRFLILYGALYAGYGVQSHEEADLLADRGLVPRHGAPADRVVVPVHRVLRRRPAAPVVSASS